MEERRQPSALPGKRSSSSPTYAPEALTSPTAATGSLDTAPVSLSATKSLGSSTCRVAAQFCGSVRATKAMRDRAWLASIGTGPPNQAVFCSAVTCASSFAASLAARVSCQVIPARTASPLPSTKTCELTCEVRPIPKTRAGSTAPENCPSAPSTPSIQSCGSCSAMPGVSLDVGCGREKLASCTPFWSISVAFVDVVPTSIPIRQKSTPVLPQIPLAVRQAPLIVP